MGILPGADLPTSGDTSGFQQTKIWPLPDTWLRRQKAAILSMERRAQASPSQLPVLLVCHGVPSDPCLPWCPAGRSPRSQGRAQLCSRAVPEQRSEDPAQSGNPQHSLPFLGNASVDISNTDAICNILDQPPKLEVKPICFVFHSLLKNCHWTPHLLLLRKYFILRKARLFVFLDFNSAALECF